MKKRLSEIMKRFREYLPLSWRDWCVFLLSMSASCALTLLMQKLISSDVYVPLIFVLCTLVISLMTEGYFYGILAAVLSVFAVNWAFTYPYFKLDFSMYGYPITFMTMLAVCFAVSTLTARLKAQERERAEIEKEKMRANLLRALSHDLRTPLTTISGSIGAVLDGKGELSPQQSRELLEDAKNDAEWLCRMVENLLSITRMGDGERTIKKQPEMMEEVIGESVMNFQKRNSGITVNVSVPDTLFFVDMDAMLIEQVLLNIMDNAVIHGVTTTQIDITVEIVGGFTAVRIADNGKGISGSSMEHLFDGRLQLSGESNADKTRCMGIGLSVCQTIIQAHGGTISAHNTGKGAEFVFTLPTGGAYEGQG